MLNLKRMISSVVSLMVLAVYVGALNAEGQENYNLAVIPQFDTKQTREIWEPILDEIKNTSGIQISLVIHGQTQIFENQVEKNQYDLVFSNPYHAMRLHKQFGYQPVIRDVSQTLKGIIVIPKDSPITHVRELDGKNIVMPSPNSLAASLMPRREFAEIFKIKPVYSYVKSHDSVYLNVALHQADAGAGEIGTFNKQPEEVRKNLQILHETKGIARHPVMVHSRISAAVMQKIQDAFITLGKTSHGKKLLEKIPIKEAGKATLSDYQDVTRMGFDRYYVKQ